MADLNFNQPESRKMCPVFLFFNRLDLDYVRIHISSFHFKFIVHRDGKMVLYILSGIYTDF